MAAVIGIDLAGSPKRDTGFCVIKGKKASVSVVHEDLDILDLVRRVLGEDGPYEGERRGGPGLHAGGVLIGIDAPLSLPAGRNSIDNPGPHPVHFRKCDIALRTLGIRFFPITLGPMRMLTKRGMALKEKLSALTGAETRSAGMRGWSERADRPADRFVSVFEVYPGATYDLFGVPRKDKARILSWASGIVDLGGRGDAGDYTQDELDALAAAITMKLYSEGKADAIGSEQEGQIIVPKPACERPAKP